MEEERFFSGYCRRIDGSRTVCACFEGNHLTDVDCSYESCLYAEGCPIGREISGQTERKDDMR